MKHSRKRRRRAGLTYEALLEKAEQARSRSDEKAMAMALTSLNRLKRLKAMSAAAEAKPAIRRAEDLSYEELDDLLMKTIFGHSRAEHMRATATTSSDHAEDA